MSFDECPKFEIPLAPLIPNIDAQLVKAKVKKHWYSIVYPGTKTMFDDVSTGKFKSGENKHFLKKDSDWEKYVPA